MGRAKAISGVIPLCSLTSVYFTLLFKQFQLTTKLWPKVRAPYTLSNGSIMALTNTITHLIQTTFIYGTQIPSPGYALILARTTPRSPFLFPRITWALLVNSNCNSPLYGPDKFISITISMEARRLIYGLVFLPVHSPAH